MAGKRTKRRTHRKVSEEELAKIPRSMVLRLGASLRNHSLTQLVKDFRNVMQPHTAINLRERKSNKLKDFVVMAGPLGVSDLFVFNQSEETGAISLRLGKMPRGPTLQFRVNSYSLMKDVARMLRRPKSAGKDAPEFHNPPLLVMNGFSSKVGESAPHEQLLVTMLQNLFPPIQPQLTNVGGIKRVLMIHRDASGDLSLRHYAINTKLVDGSRSVKKLINSHHNVKKSMPNLSRADDVADMLLDPYAVGGLTSDSEVEDDAVVEVQDKPAVSRKDDAPAGTQPTRKRAIKLTELGPRLNMTLMKIEEGLVGSSKTIYHSQVTKSSKDVERLDKQHMLKQQQKAERRAKQQANVAAKLKVKEEKKQRKLARKNGEVGAGAGLDSGLDSGSDSDRPQLDAQDYEDDLDLYSDVAMSDDEE